MTVHPGSPASADSISFCVSFAMPPSYDAPSKGGQALLPVLLPCATHKAQDYVAFAHQPKVFRRKRRNGWLVVEQFPSFVNAAKLERRAQQIADPIERLRYLRQAAVPRPPSRPRWRMLAAFCFVILLLPLHSVSDVRRPVDSGRPLRPAHPGAPDMPAVWLVGQTAVFESYSTCFLYEKGLPL